VNELLNRYAYNGENVEREKANDDLPWGPADNECAENECDRSQSFSSSIL